MLATEEERNCDCVQIHYQYLALSRPDDLTVPPETQLQIETGLTLLLKQQGHTMSELQSVMKDYNEFFYADELPKEVFDEKGNKLSLDKRIDMFNQNHNAFLTSVCQELENQRYSMGVMTVLAKMSIKDFIEMQKGNREITMPKDCMLGIYNPWNGSGSVLEVELEKDFVFSTDLIRDIQIEGVKPQFEYTVDDTYGLIGSCWESPTSVVEQKKGLDEVIKSCEALNNNSGKEVLGPSLKNEER